MKNINAKIRFENYVNKFLSECDESYIIQFVKEILKDKDERLIQGICTELKGLEFKQISDDCIQYERTIIDIEKLQL